MKQPLYRKENTTAHLARHEGGDYRDERQRSQRSAAPRESMHGRKRRSLDYTPLFKFLLSKRGQPWDAVHDEASKCCTHTFNGVPFTRPFEDLGKLPRAGEMRCNESPQA